MAKDLSQAALRKRLLLTIGGATVATTTGGAVGTTVKVSTLADLTTNAGGTDARILQISGTITGDVTIGSNKTLVGTCGAKIHGHIQLIGSANVIVRNLTVVGNDCADGPSDCSGGAAAITVQSSSHHLWFDHLDISDGSDATALASAWARASSTTTTSSTASRTRSTRRRTPMARACSSVDDHLDPPAGHFFIGTWRPPSR